MAVVVAVMLKYFIVEAYQIPSGSMQPTLMGSPETGVFDRILVDKLSFHLRDPERWEVCVFKYPLDRSKSFIKRLVGMPDEDLRVQYGDVWTRKDSSQPWTVLRRPRPVQEAVWKELDPDNSRYAAWKPDAGARAWAFQGRSGFSARGKGSVQIPAPGESVLDHYLDGYPKKMRDVLNSRDRIQPFLARPGAKGMPDDPRPHNSDVGDLRVEGDIEALASLKSVGIEFREGERRYVFTLPGPAAAADARTRCDISVPAESKAYPEQPDSRVVRADERPAEQQRLAAGKKVSFAAQNMDDLLQLEIDGEIVMQVEIPATADQRSAIVLSFDGDAEVRELELYRDIYYLLGNVSEFHIPAGHYVMLGDNTQDSSDSRDWRFIHYRWDGPGSNGEWVRGNMRERAPQPDGNENPSEVLDEQGSRIFFRDEWGERHTFATRDGMRGSVEPAPYVPRGLITGRAVLVFWPLPPFGAVPRLKWIR